MYARGREKKGSVHHDVNTFGLQCVEYSKGTLAFVGYLWNILSTSQTREREVWIALERVDRRFHTLFSLYCCAGSPIRLKHTLSAAKCPHNIDTHGLSLLLPVCQNHNLLSIPRPLEAIVETTLTNFFKKTKKQQQHIKLKISQLKWNNKKQRHFTPKTGKEAN